MFWTDIDFWRRSVWNAVSFGGRAVCQVWLGGNLSLVAAAVILVFVV